MKGVQDSIIGYSHPLQFKKGLEDGFVICVMETHDKGDAMNRVWLDGFGNNDVCHQRLRL